MILCSFRKFSTSDELPLDHSRPRIYIYFADAKSLISFLSARWPWSERSVLTIDCMRRLEDSRGVFFRLVLLRPFLCLRATPAPQPFRFGLPIRLAWVVVAGGLHSRLTGFVRPHPLLTARTSSCGIVHAIDLDRLKKACQVDLFPVVHPHADSEVTHVTSHVRTNHTYGFPFGDSSSQSTIGMG